MKKAIISLLVIAVVVVGGYLIIKNFSGEQYNAPKTQETDTETPDNTSTTTQSKPQVNSAQTVIGKSVEGRDIIAYNFGTGSKKVLFVGGIHGGYEWNTVLAGYELADYLKANPNAIPKNIQVTVIPVLNPDGLNKVVGTAGRFEPSDVSPSESTVVSGRFNANNVDLNRNFDCDWKSSGKWQTRTVSGGTKVFSEPESLAMKNYIEANKPAAAIVFYSSAGGVYASSCNSGILPETTKIMNAYAKASGYPSFSKFDFYETSGDMVNWLAKNNIPAISVLLTDHTNTEWVKNKAGAEAVLKYFAE